MGPVGIEPTTFGLKVRLTLWPFVSSGGRLRGRTRVFSRIEVPFVSSFVALCHSVRLQIGLHSSAR